MTQGRMIKIACFYETGARYIAQTDLELCFPAEASKCWVYRYASSHLAWIEGFHILSKLDFLLF